MNKVGKFLLPAAIFPWRFAKTRCLFSLARVEQRLPIISSSLNSRKRSGHGSPRSTCCGARRPLPSGVMGTPWWPSTGTSTCSGGLQTTPCPTSSIATMWTPRPGRSSSPAQTVSYPVGDSSTQQQLSQMLCTSSVAQWTIISEVERCTGSSFLVTLNALSMKTMEGCGITGSSVTWSLFWERRRSESEGTLRSSPLAASG